MIEHNPHTIDLMVDIVEAAQLLYKHDDFDDDQVCPVCSPLEPDDYLAARKRLAAALNSYNAWLRRVKA